MAFFMLKIVIFVAEMVLIAAEWRLWTRMASFLTELAPFMTKMAPRDGNGAPPAEMAPPRRKWRLTGGNGVSASCGHPENVDLNGRKTQEAKFDENVGLSKVE